MVRRIEKDAARFREIIRGRIKRNLRKYITRTELIGRKGKDLVSIPVPQIEIPHFAYKWRDVGGVGQGEGEEGTPIGVDQVEGGRRAGSEPGEHILEVELTIEELVQLLAEELELPNLQPKGSSGMATQKARYKTIRKVGPESLRHFKRTYKEALKRQIISGTYNHNAPIVIPIREDRRYRSWEYVEEPESRAVIFYMMDVSGCHTAGHFVEMADGSYKDVKDVQVGDWVACMDLATLTKTHSVVTRTFHYQAPFTLSIATDDHVQLRVTPNHRYFVFEEFNNRLVEKEAEDLQPGDYLVLVNQHGVDAPAESDLTEGDAYLIGVLLGDGHIFRNERAYSRYIAVTDENLNRLSRYQDAFEQVYGIRGIVKPANGNPHRRNRLHVNSTWLARHLCKWFPMLTRRSRERAIEPLLFRQRPEVRAAFLRGLFDAEGTVAAHAVEMVSSSLSLVKQVKLMLSYWGIRARIHRKWQDRRDIKGREVQGGWYYVLSINAKEVLRFAKCIGFGCPEKSAKLNELVRRQQRMKNAMRSRYLVPVGFRDMFAELDSLEKIKARLYEYDRNAYSEANLLRMRRHHGLSEEQVTVLERLLSRPLLVCRVKSIEWINEAVDVYDFTVDRYHNYIVDGVLSHNSMGEEQKEIVRIEAFWIDAWLKSQYKGIERRYIIHDAAAREVDEETFYRTRESGGTKISSAYRLCADIIDKVYDPTEWNIYAFHFSDGDNWEEDDEVAFKALGERLLPKLNLFCYGQVASHWGTGRFIYDLEEEFEDEENLVVSEIKSKDDIYDSIKAFLGKAV